MAGNTIRFPTTKRKEIKNDTNKIPVTCPECGSSYLFAYEVKGDTYIRCYNCLWSKLLK